MKKLLASIMVLSTALFSPLPAWATTTPAPSPLNGNHVSVTVSNVNTSAKTGTVQMTWGNSVTNIPNFFGDSLFWSPSEPGSYRPHHRLGASETRLMFYDIGSPIAGAVYPGSSWSDLVTAYQEATLSNWDLQGADPFTVNASVPQSGNTLGMACAWINYAHAAFSNGWSSYVVCSSTFELFDPPPAPPAPPTLVSGPTLSISGDSLVQTPAVFSSGVGGALTVRACNQPFAASPSVEVSLPTAFQASCGDLNGVQNGLSSASIFLDGQHQPFSLRSATHRFLLVTQTHAPSNLRVWSATVEYSDPSLSPTASPGLTPSGEEEEPAPVLFGGPKIASFVKAAAASAPSSQLQFVGKRMNKVTSASVGGLQATISVTRSTLSITVPEGLAPGIYNLVLESTDGRITIMRFVTVR